MAFYLRSRINSITHQIIGAAIEIHRRLGPGLFESTYHTCMAHELKCRELKFRSKVQLPLNYKGIDLDAAYQIDLLVEELVIVELKAVQDLAPIHDAQLMTYLKLTGAPIGLLINFHVPLLRAGIKRFVNNEHQIVNDFDPCDRDRLEQAQAKATNVPK